MDGATPWRTIAPEEMPQPSGALEVTAALPPTKLPLQSSSSQLRLPLAPCCHMPSSQASHCSPGICLQPSVKDCLAVQPCGKHQRQAYLECHESVQSLPQVIAKLNFSSAPSGDCPAAPQHISTRPCPLMLQAITKQLSLKRPDLVAQLRPSSSGLSPLASPNMSVEPPALSGTSGRGTSRTMRASADGHLQPEAPAPTVGAKGAEQEGAGKLDASLKGLRSHPLDAADMALGVHLSRDASEEWDREPQAKLESLPAGPGRLAC